MRNLLARAVIVGGWLVMVISLSLLVAEAVHRGQAAGVWITSIGLAGAVLTPLVAHRLRS